MKVSYKWVQEYVDFPLPPIAELVQRIGAQLGEVETVTDLGARYQKIVIARIISCHKLENSDHLNVCLIDDGGITEGVERNEQNLVQVVCGAPNVREGLLVAWLPPGSTVPSSYDKEPFILGSRQLRGVTSNGMLASAQELAINDNHDGILEIDVKCEPGASLAEVYQLNDYIIDIENKMFTHRPDCFGILGIAREIAGILGQPFNEPDWFRAVSSDLQPADEQLSLVVKNEAPELAPRLMAAALSNVVIQPSSISRQTFLMRVGIRPINNIVDATNYCMYLTGQPLHAYDYDKVAALDGSDTATLIARQVRAGETLVLLNGKTLEPRDEAIVITTESQLIGLAGVMGGASTEVDNSTQRIILECANFEMYSIRKTSMTHGLFSEAVTRFNKGQSPYQNDLVLGYIIALLGHDYQTTLASEIIDAAGQLVDINQTHVGVVNVSANFIGDRLGREFTVPDISQLLTNVGFMVQPNEAGSNDDLAVSIPFWRTDIAIAEDIVEEVGRLYGFDRLPLALPVRSLAPANTNDFLDFKAAIRRALSRAGANEVLTYSFVHGNLLIKAGQKPGDSYRLINALSPELQYYRQSLTPSLLDKVHGNIKAGYGEFALFELGRAHVVAADNQAADGLPAEYERLSLVFAADTKSAQQYSGAAFYQAKTYLEAVLQAAGTRSVIEFVPTETVEPLYATGRTAAVKVSGVVLGYIGEYSAAVRTALKLPEFCAGFELDTAVLQQLSSQTKAYFPLPKFPKLSQDICLRVPSTVAYQQMLDLVTTTADQSYRDHARVVVAPVDIFQKPDDADYKQITLRLSLASYQRTLTDAEVSKLLDTIVEAATAQFQAARV